MPKFRTQTSANRTYPTAVVPLLPQGLWQDGQPRAELPVSPDTTTRGSRANRRRALANVPIVGLAAVARGVAVAGGAVRPPAVGPGGVSAVILRPTVTGRGGPAASVRPAGTGGGGCARVV